MKRQLTAAEIEAAREARREYMRKWRAKNRERIREYDRQYWARRAAVEILPEAPKQD